MERTARQVFQSYGYQEIRTPILEETELFVRSVGASTDIVGKEMYTFEDRKGRSLTLRPESTASVVRALVQQGLKSEALPVKLFYMGPQFRYERPQKGRYRQFHQIGAELIGDPGPYSDVEVIVMLVRFLTELGFEDLVVQLNTVGDESTRAAYRQGLQRYFEPLRERLSEDSRRRLETNPLRILDTKDPDERCLLADAPQLIDHLSSESRQHFDTVQAGLERQGLSFRIDPRLVRGLDYYTRTVFEIVSEGLGAQDAIVGGGRYDGLVEELGGPALPGIGFAIGEDRLVEVLPRRFSEDIATGPTVSVLSVGAVPVEEALATAEVLRRGGYATVTEFGGRSLKSALKRADRLGVRWAVIVGDEELAADEVTVRDLEAGEQVRIPLDRLVEQLRGSA